MFLIKIEAYAVVTAITLAAYIEAVGTNSNPLWKLMLAVLFIINATALVSKLKKSEKS